ncbi:MAG: alpha/beta fold hydrolase, partial [Candidatus Rokuibacteriota bacterium]
RQGRGQGEGAGGEGAGGEGRQGDGTRTVTVWNGRVPIRVHVKGAGPAVVFFHGPWGLTWGPFLDALARQFTVHAPEHPGTTPGEPDAIQHVDHLWDLVLCYDELLDHLKLREVILAGHSFGAMMACEVAALQPARVKRLALIDPIGLWRDDAPVINWMLLAPAEMPAHVFHEPDGAAAKTMFSMPEEAEAAALARTRLTWAMGATGKFIWPIPDKGLKKRIHRVTAPTLLVWGEHDRLVPRAYAKEFAGRLKDTRIEVVTGAGHAPHLEQPEATARVVQGFLKG